METRFAPITSETPGRSASNPDEALRQIRTKVSSAVGQDRFDRYFDSQAVLHVEGNRLDVTVPTPFMAQFIDRRFGPALRTAAKEILARDPSVIADETPLTFRVEPGAFGSAGGTPVESTGPAVEPRRRAVAITKPAPDAQRASRYTFGSFVVGASNRTAHAAALRLAEGDGPAALHRLFIQGPCGVGKTHLLRAIASRFKEHRPHARVRYATGEEFTNAYIAAVRSNSLEGFRKAFRSVDLLCLDDAHFLAGKDKTQTELLHTFDALDLEGSRIALASDEHPRDIRQLSEQLVSRFLSAGVVRIEPPDAELRECILRAVAARRGLRVDEAALRLLVERTGHGAGASVRDVEGAITQSEALVRVLGEKTDVPTITPGVVRRALRLDEPAAPARGGRPVPFQLVISEVCRELGVSQEEFCGRGRHKRVVLARSLCAFLGRSLTTLSYPEMARMMGRPTHSTLIMACARVRARLDDGKDPGLEQEMGPEAATLTLRGLCERLRAVVIRAAERPAGPAPREVSGPGVPSGR